jgi:hypothetical protein
MFDSFYTYHTTHYHHSLRTATLHATALSTE